MRRLRIQIASMDQRPEQLRLVGETTGTFGSSGARAGAGDGVGASVVC